MIALALWVALGITAIVGIIVVVRSDERLR